MGEPTDTTTTATREATGPAKETAVTTKTQRTKKAAKAKTPKAKPTKAPKPKREKLAKHDLVTFAVRLPKADAAAFHKAAGPARGSHVARQLLVAFATGDDAAFRAAVKEASQTLAAK